MNGCTFQQPFEPRLVILMVRSLFWFCTVHVCGSNAEEVHNYGSSVWGADASRAKRHGSLSVFAMVSNGVDTCEVAQCRFDVGCWRPLCPYRHSGRGRAAMWARVPRGREAREGEKETRETGVVADGVEGVSVEAETLFPLERVQQLTAEQIGNVPRVDVKNSATATCTTVAKLVGDGEARLPSGEDGSSFPGADDTNPRVDATVAKTVGEARPPGIAEHSVTTASLPRERVQQRTAEEIDDAPQSPEETVEAVTPVPRERVQQHTAQQIEDTPQSPEETVEAVTLVPRERVQQHTAGKLVMSQSGVLRPNVISQCPLVKLGPLGPEQMTWTVPPLQQP